MSLLSRRCGHFGANLDGAGVGVDEVGHRLQSRFKALIGPGGHDEFQRGTRLEVGQVFFLRIDLHPQAARVGDDKERRSAGVGAQLLPWVQVAFDHQARQSAGQRELLVHAGLAAIQTRAGLRSLEFGLCARRIGLRLFQVFSCHDAGVEQGLLSLQLLEGPLHVGLCTGGVGLCGAKLGRSQFG
jgi:hypothetical protein